MILKKIKNIILVFKKVANSKIIFKSPEKKNILVFDNYQIDFFKSFLDEKNIFELSVIDETRKLERIYISFEVIFFLIKHILVGNFRICYFAAIIEIVKPKNIITFFDNNFIFYKINKVFCRTIKCTAIQNAYRDIEDYDKKKLSLINIDNYMCLGKQTKDYLLDKKVNINNFIFLGSPRQFVAEKYFEDKKLIDENKKYDLCYIAAGVPPIDFDTKSNEEIIFNGIKKIINYLKMISEENNLKSIICLKQDFANISKYKSKHMNAREEKLFFENLVDNHPNITLKENKREEFTSYLYSYQSKLVIGIKSTLLLENLAKGNKILCCAYYAKEFTNMNQLNPMFLPNELISLYDDSYQEFKKRVNLLLSMPQKEYLNNINNVKNYMLNYNKPANFINIINNHFKNE